MNPTNTVGLDLGASGTLGLVNGATGTGSVAAVSSDKTPLAVLAQGGAVAKLGNTVKATPQQNSGTSIYGAYIGGGLQPTYSNGEPSQLKGNFQMVSVQVGVGSLNFGFQMACSGLVCSYTMSPPGITWGLGVSITAHTTNTSTVKPVIGPGCTD